MRRKKKSTSKAFNAALDPYMCAENTKDHHHKNNIILKFIFQKVGLMVVLWNKVSTKRMTYFDTIVEDPFLSNYLSWTKCVIKITETNIP